MIDLIIKIFAGNNYEVRHSSNYSIYSLRDKHNFYVITSKEDLSDVLNEQIDLFLQAKEIISESQFDKNANLLILHKVIGIDSVNKSEMLDIEEDPFHFKKSIIYYTERELDKLNEAIGELDVLTSIESFILNEQIFEEHKNNFDKNEYQSLLFRIAHKIPFIKINVTQVNNLSSLEEINLRSIQDNNLNELLENEFYTLTNDELSVLSNEILMEKLKSILPNENQ